MRDRRTATSGGCAKALVQEQVLAAEWESSTDSLVRATLAGQTLTADQRTRALIDELIRKGPAEVEQEIAEVVRQQREAGKWP